MTSDLAITLASAFGIFFIGILVYFHDRKNASNILFFLITLTTVFWAIANYFSLNIAPDSVLFWIRLVLFFAAPHAVLFFIFVYNFPNPRIILSKRAFTFFLGILVVTMGATVSPFVFSGIELEGGRVVPTPGPLMPFFALVVISSLIAGIILIIRKYFRATAIEKVQWRMMLFGVFVSYLSLIFTNFVLVILFGNTSFIIFGPIYMLPTIIGMGYAILRHHLLNVKGIATEILTFVILSISLFEVFVSKSITELVVSIFIFILFFIFGILLIRSVLKEVEQREKLQKLTEDLNATNTKLTELDQLKSEFLNFAAHQVKSPMVNVKGFAELIMDGTAGQVSDEVKEKAKRIKDNADRTMAVVSDLLDLGKIESGKMEYQFKEVDIAAILKSMVEDYKGGATAKGLDFQFESAAASVSIKADEQKMRQVIQNVIDNSIKYTDKGFVKVKLEEQGDYVVISVSDSGRGMSAELQKKLFGRFVRDEKTKNEIRGTGLGLYLAKQFVSAHNGGKIWATSAGEGKGSQFFVQLAKH